MLYGAMLHIYMLGLWDQQYGNNSPVSQLFFSLAVSTQTTYISL